MAGRTLLAVCCLALAVQHSLAALAIKRPSGDCAFPAVTKINSVNYFPPNSNSQIRSITPVVSDELSTTVTIAKDFSVQYFGTYKVVTNKLVNETYVLYQCGTPNPLDFQDGVAPGVPSDAKAFQIPLVSISAPDTTINGFLNELGLFNRVALASSYSIDSCMQALTSTCGLAAKDSFSANASELAAQKTIVDAEFGFSKKSDSNSIAFTATLDPGTLDRAEWIKFVAPFFNMEPAANQLFDTINATYNQLKATAAAAAGTTKPTVAWMYAINTTIAFGYPWNGKAIIFSLPAYKNQYIMDAGGKPLNNNTLLTSYAPAMVPESYSPTVNVMLNVTADPGAAHTALLDILKDVDVIIDETFSASNIPTKAMFLKEYNISTAEAATIPALANERVYTELGVVSASGSDWFERVVARPDLVLANFVAAITPSAAASANFTNAAPDSKWLLPLGGTPLVLSPASCTTLQDCKRTAPTPILPSSLVADNTTTPAAAPAPKNSAGAVAGGAGALVASGLAAAAALLLL